MAQLNFNAAEVKPIGDNEPVPAAEYTVIMVESEMKPANKDPDSYYLACSYEIVEGEYKGRKVFDNLNLGN